MATLPHYDVISFGAHPDDVEVGTGGVLIDLHKRGYKCGMVILTQGEMGTGGTPAIRLQEVQQGAKILGADLLEIFDWGDAKLEDTYGKRLEIAKILRKTKPKIILTTYPHPGHGRAQSHPDHIAAGLITTNAISLAHLKKIDIPGEPHLVKRIFHYAFPPQVMPHFIVDITPHFDRWIEALSAHPSQFLNPEKKLNYIELWTAMARSFGLLGGCKYAHGFTCVEPLQLKNMMALVQDA